MRYDLVDLRLFVAIVDAGSISRGAAAAHLALASASARVNGMEAELGAPLLARGPRGVVPTAAGRALLDHARAVTAQLERMRHDLGTFASGLRGTLRVLCNTAAMVDLVPRALRVFLGAHPGVDVQLDERASRDVAGAVAEGRSEIGVVASSADLGGLETRPLLADRLVAIVPAGHPLAIRGELPFVDLLDEPFVSLRAGALPEHLAHNASRLGRRIAHRVQLGSLGAVAKLVGAGVGVSVVPRAALRRGDRRAVAVVRLTDPWAQRRLLVCAAAFERLGLHGRLLVEELQRQAQVRPRAA